MEEKYYQPKIEEFHEGFLYQEMLSDKTWMDMKFEVEYGYPPIEHTRVKHLNQEDIESVGWDEDFESKGRFTLGEYVLYRFRNDGLLTIKKGYSYEKHGTSFYGFDILFEGTIKNKSQLMQVMEMLGINFNTNPK